MLVSSTTQGQRVKITGAEPFVFQYVQASLTQSSDPAGIYASRIRGRQIMLENPARDSNAKRERDAKRAKRVAEKKRKQLGIPSLRKMSEKGVWKLADVRFELFLPLHRLWLGYMSELLGLPVSSPGDALVGQANMPSSAGMHAKLVKADFHGSIMTGTYTHSFHVTKMISCSMYPSPTKQKPLPRRALRYCGSRN